MYTSTASSVKNINPLKLNWKYFWLDVVVQHSFKRFMKNTFNSIFHKNQKLYALKCSKVKSAFFTNIYFIFVFENL